jgi:hypothetical protein
MWFLSPIDCLATLEYAYIDDIYTEKVVIYNSIQISSWKLFLDTHLLLL